jgi:putative Holliday junction resolvase
MRILGIDHGDVRIGLALSDESNLIARPLQVLKHVARDADAQSVARIALEKKAQLIVVGLPVDDEGQVGYQARKVKRWVEGLSHLLEIQIEFWDESFSSAEADALTPSRHRDEANDARAAAVMLQNYLDSHRASD